MKRQQVSVVTRWCAIRCSARCRARGPLIRPSPSWRSSCRIASWPSARGGDLLRQDGSGAGGEVQLVPQLGRNRGDGGRGGRRREQRLHPNLEEVRDLQEGVHQQPLLAGLEIRNPAPA